MTSGSSLESFIDELLVCSLPDPAKELTAAWRLYSSSTSRRRLCFRKSTTPTMIPTRAITPTTTPAAMAVLLGPLEVFFDAPDEADEAASEAVTTTVDPPIVTTAAGADVLLADVALLLAEDGS